MSFLYPSTINNIIIPSKLHHSTYLTKTSKKSIISCKSLNNSNDNKNPNNTTQKHDTAEPVLDRRNMLIGLGGLYGSGLTLPIALPAKADPIAPDVTRCTLTAAAWDDSIDDFCCPPTIDPTKIKDFKFEDYLSPVLKVRRPVHVVSNDPEFVRDYKRAIGIMRTGLTPNDPRNFYQQAKIHCAYCDDAYPQINNPDKRLEVHNSWLFMSFHRWYLFFYERILGKLINKPEFALPFWNWDNPDGMRVPEMFNDVDSSLYDPNRNVDHLSSVIDFNYFSRMNSPPPPDDTLIPENLEVMRKQMLYATIPSVFFGKEYRLGQALDRDGGGGTIENSPHNVVHGWMGSKTVRGGQDMGAFWSAARDPIFYCHHSNVDRMWHLWRTELPGKSRVDIKDPDYLNAWFVFYDENAKPVRVKIGDSFDVDKLGYTYEKVDLPWLYRRIPSRPPPPLTKTKVLSSSLVEPATTTFPKKLDSVVKTSVIRPGKKRSKQEKEEQEEVLVVEFNIPPTDEFVKFDVYVNDRSSSRGKDKDDSAKIVCPELAGSYAALPHRGAHMMMKGNNNQKMVRKTSLKLALNTLLEELGDEDNEVVEVTLVPRTGAQDIEITSVKIVYASE